MPLLARLDVIVILDDFIRVPGPKMVACVSPEAGFFFRINTDPFPVPVRLLRSENGFLQWDSHLECNGPLEFDDYVIRKSLDKHGGPIGRLALRLIPEIWAAVRANGRLAPTDIETIRIGLGVERA